MMGPKEAAVWFFLLVSAAVAADALGYTNAPRIIGNIIRQAGVSVGHLVEETGRAIIRVLEGAR